MSGEEVVGVAESTSTYETGVRNFKVTVEYEAMNREGNFVPVTFTHQHDRIHGLQLSESRNFSEGDLDVIYTGLPVLVESSFSLAFRYHSLINDKKEE